MDTKVANLEEYLLGKHDLPNYTIITSPFKKVEAPQTHQQGTFGFPINVICFLPV